MIDQLLGALRPSGEGVEIDGMVTGLVAVGILSDETRGIAVHLTAGGCEGEVLIKLS